MLLITHLLWKHKEWNLLENVLNLKSKFLCYVIYYIWMHKFLQVCHFGAKKEGRNEVFADKLWFFFFYDSTANSETFIHDGHQRYSSSVPIAAKLEVWQAAVHFHWIHLFVKKSLCLMFLKSSQYKSTFLFITKLKGIHWQYVLFLENESYAGNWYNWYFVQHHPINKSSWIKWLPATPEKAYCSVPTTTNQQTKFKTVSASFFARVIIIMATRGGQDPNWCIDDPCPCTCRFVHLDKV